MVSPNPEYQKIIDDMCITVTKLEYFRLRVIAEKLHLLETGGVDNWDWYGESLNPDEGETLEQAEERLRKEILLGEEE